MRGSLTGLSSYTYTLMSIELLIIISTNNKPNKIQLFQVMKALCYAAKLVSGLYVSSNADTSKKFAIFSSRISGARATLRYTMI